MSHQEYDRSNTGYFLSSVYPDFRYSFPAGENREAFYQVKQLLLRPKGPLAKPELYEAMIDAKPNQLTDLLAVRFEADKKIVNPARVSQIKEAYGGLTRAVAFTPEAILFEVALLENSCEQLHFIGSAYIQEVGVDEDQRVARVDLNPVDPYFLYHFKTPKLSTQEIEFESFVEKKLKEIAVVRALEDMSKEDSVERINVALYTIVRTFMRASRAASGNLSGLPSFHF